MHSSSSKNIYIKKPYGLIFNESGQINIIPYTGQSGEIQDNMRQTVSFIRACDMCKDAATGGNIDGIVPIIFESIGVNNSIVKGEDHINIDSAHIGKEIGSELKNQLIQNNPKVTMAEGNLQIIDLLNSKTKLIPNLRMYTLDANIVPNYYKCSDKYKKILAFFFNSYPLFSKCKLIMILLNELKIESQIH